MTKIIKITEDQFGVLEAIYPSSFDLNVFSNLKSFAKRKKYAEQHLKRISSGSARIVYIIDDNTVLKMAKNEKGIAQNEAEISARNLYDHITANIYEYDDDYMWLEMERAKKVKEKDFVRLIGFEFEDIAKAIVYRGRKAKGQDPKKYNLSLPSNYSEIAETDWYSSLESFMVNFKLEGTDLAVLSAYGVVNRKGKEQIVVVDYGTNSDVFNTHYK